MFQLLLFMILSASPPGMVWISGGEFTMGSDKLDTKLDERPAHRVKVDGFWMDETPVTNRQFQEFVEKTGYVTVAEIAPTLEEIMAQVPPGTPEPSSELLVAGALVFNPPKEKVPLSSCMAWWEWTKGADWRHPEGPGTSIIGKEDHPVVHVAWVDANAYAKWANKRLPTEAEWEYAAKAGRENALYVWGDEEFDEKTPQANLWQGEFPHKSEKPAGTTPVKAFSKNPWGLYDMAGNVWQWCSDCYRPDYYKTLKAGGLAVNPKGPLTSFDPEEPYATKYVQRGGSYLCHKSYCKGYRITARMKTAHDTGMSHSGFRCVLGEAGTRE
jgi:sulfatase modifying factor 1